MKEIYNLELHEATMEGSSAITRVPGGWIYTMFELQLEQYLPPVFVPFNDEFKEK